VSLEDFWRMEDYSDDLERLAAAGLCGGRRSSAVGLATGSRRASLVPADGHRDSLDSGGSSGSEAGSSSYRVLVMGASRVGKTAIISQFLYDQFCLEYKPTVEEMYRGEFDIGAEKKLSLNIEDTSGTFAWDFPAMVEVSLSAADAVLLVFSHDDPESLETVGHLRDLVMKSRGPDMPMVVAGNKTDVDPALEREQTEALITCDWEHAYVGCSAKENSNIGTVWRELLLVTRNTGHCPLSSQGSQSPNNMRRRKSLPTVPVFNRDGATRARSERRGSMATLLMGKENCKVS